MLSPTVQLLEPEARELLAAQKWRDLREMLRGLPHADVAELLEELEPGEAAIAFRILPRDDASEVFAYLASERQEELIEAFGEGRATRLVEDMDPDDRARLLDELPAEVSGRILLNLKPETKRQTQAILGYDSEQIGRLMTPDYVRVKPDWTVERALAHIRRWGRDAETLHWVYVVDADGRLIDDLFIRQLLLAPLETPIADLMDSKYVALSATDDREEAVRLLARYDRTVLPVIDSRGILVGIVTFDDVQDVQEEEATEDIQKLGGLAALDHAYLETGAGEMIRKRGPWLAALFVMQVLTITVMGAFEDQLTRAVVLSLFVPMIISLGGNTGSQTSTLLVRAIALGEVELRDWGRVVLHEIRSGLPMGLILGGMGIGVVWLLHAMGVAATEYPWIVGGTIAMAVLTIVVWATIVGSTLPLVLQRLRLDPATSSSPLVATLMDVSGVAIYLGYCTLLLRGTLL
ncbi:MAG: magnesium transporter [Phycisphaerales bacterium]